MKPSINGLLQVIVTLPILFFLLGFLGRFHWLLDLFSHFRIQYAAALLLCAPAFLLLKHKRSAVFSALGGGIIAATIFLPLPSRTVPLPNSPRLKLVSFNVNTSNSRKDEVLRFLEHEDADVCFLMEVNDDWIRQLRPLEGRYPHCLLSPREDNFGIALYSKRPIQGEVEAWGEDDLPWANVRLVAEKIRLAAIHTLPPAGEAQSKLRNDQLADIAGKLATESRVVLCGDFNLSPFSPWFSHLLSQNGLSGNVPSLSPTWMRGHPLFAIPIDHVLAGPELAFASRKLGPSLGSDHNAVIVEIVDAKH